MKKKFLILILNSIILNAQNSAEEINKLEKTKAKISEKIISLNDSIRFIDLKISTLKSEEILKQVKDLELVAIVQKDGILRKKPSPIDDIIMILEEDTKVLILDYYDGYFGVCINSVCGYVSNTWVKSNDKIDELIKVKINEAQELNKIKEENKIKAENQQFAEIENRNIKKYGKVIYERLKRGDFWLEMTADMAIISLGNPKDVNRTVGAWGVHEQWVYGENYYYFENGILKSYQN